jgi:hypothetical protein
MEVFCIGNKNFSAEKNSGVASQMDKEETGQ